MIYCYISTLKLNDLLLNLFISYLKVPLNCNDFKRNPEIFWGLLPQTPLGGLTAPLQPPAVCTKPLRGFVFPRYARPHQFLGGSTVFAQTFVSIYCLLNYIVLKILQPFQDLVHFFHFLFFPSIFLCCQITSWFWELLILAYFIWNTSLLLILLM